METYSIFIQNFFRKQNNFVYKKCTAVSGRNVNKLRPEHLYKFLTETTVNLFENKYKGVTDSLACRL